MTNSPSVTKSAGSNRAYALDALRGLAILAMLLSGQMPFDRAVLPAWMYHAQVPPPKFEFNPLVYGITWVDLVFPFFLFSMGAAFPLAFSRRMEQGTPPWKLSGFILERGFLLGFFALYVEAIRPYVISHEPNAGTYLLALLGFFLLFPILTRLPEKWPRLLRWAIKISGWAGAMLFLALVRYPDGSGFKLGRSDIIIIVLTNMAVFGSIVWLLTRNHLLPRLGLLGILLAIRLSNMPHPLGGWVTDFWNKSPLPWLYQLYYLQYLCIVIPGTIAGDLILKWTRPPQTLPASAIEKAGENEMRQPGWWYGGVMVLMFGLVLLLLIGLKSRWLPQTTFIAFGVCAVGCWLLNRPRNATERLYRSLFLWATYWLVLGLFFEPYEGGIRKDKATVSYYFVTSGLANCVFIGLSIIIDVFKRKRWLQLLIDNGQNPMIAYAGINNFIIPVLALLSLQGFSVLKWLDEFASTPWRGFWKGAIITLLMALTVSFLSRRKIFWRT